MSRPGSMIEGIHMQGSNTIRIWLTGCLVTCIPLAGCGNDPKKASNENFKQIITSTLAKNPRFLKYPPSDGESLIGRGLFDYLPLRNEKTAATLAKAGFLKKQPAGYPGVPDSYEPKLERQMTWIRAFDQRTLGQGWSFLLILGESDPESVDVVRFTDPQNFMGHTVCEVEYTFRWKPTALLTDSKYKEICDTLPKNFTATQGTVSTKATLVLYSDGWRAEKV